ncbi:MAG: SdpC family antimicrobial peptide [Dokdonia sp.]|jgi:SdpC family antimicrobial peptide
MKTLRKKLKFLSFFMSFCILFVSCSQYDDGTAIDDNSADFTGQDIFKSVFFADGDFASQISSYEDNVRSMSLLSEEQKIEFSKGMNEMITSIESTDPIFFENFKNDITSKNHLQIQNAIVEGGKKLYSELQVLYPNLQKVIEKVGEDYESGKITTDDVIDAKKLEDNSDEYMSLLKNNMITQDSDDARACSFVFVCAAYFVLAIHNQVAVTFNVAVAITVAAAVAVKVTVAIDEQEEIAIENNLAFEILVDEIASIK